MELESALRKLIAEVVREELGRVLVELRSTAKALEQRPTEDEFIDVQAAADLLGLHHSTIREWIHSGRLKSYRAGRVYRLRTADVRSCLERPTGRRMPVDTDQLLKDILSRRATWETEKAEVMRIATEKGERISPHEITQRTRARLKKQYGRWPPA